MSVTSVKKNRLPPWGIHWGLPEQSLGQRGNGWGVDRHIGGRLVDSPGDSISTPRARGGARAPLASPP